MHGPFEWRERVVWAEGLNEILFNRLRRGLYLDHEECVWEKLQATTKARMPKQIYEEKHILVLLKNHCIGVWKGGIKEKSCTRHLLKTR